jgi:vacuolar-type H+-ATPase subunit D/Vma8
MKLKKLLKSLSDLLDADQREQVRNYGELKTLLKKLKKKRDQLQKEFRDLDSAESDKREKIARQLSIIAEKRKKGIASLKAIKAARGKKPPEKSGS